MAKGIKTSRKTPLRAPKGSRKAKEAARVPPPEDYDEDDTEDEDWI